MVYCRAISGYASYMFTVLGCFPDNFFCLVCWFACKKRYIVNMSPSPTPSLLSFHVNNIPIHYIIIAIFCVQVSIQLDK